MSLSRLLELPTLSSTIIKIETLIQHTYNKDHSNPNPNPNPGLHNTLMMKSILTLTLPLLLLLKRSLIAHEDSVTCVRFQPETHYFFSSGKDGVLKYWDADRCVQDQVVLELHGTQTCPSIYLNGVREEERDSYSTFTVPFLCFIRGASITGMLTDVCSVILMVILLNILLNLFSVKIC
jgi:WD40 repeat protein